VKRELAVGELAKKHGISRATFFNRRSKYPGVTVSELKRMKELELENAKLKRWWPGAESNHRHADFQAMLIPIQDYPPTANERLASDFRCGRSAWITVSDDGLETSVETQARIRSRRRGKCGR
jgi:putative transposase